MKKFKLYCPKCNKYISDSELFFVDDISAIHYHNGKFHECIKIDNTAKKDNQGKHIYNYDVLKVPIKVKTKFANAYIPIKYIVVYSDRRKKWIAEQIKYQSEFPYRLKLSDIASKSQVESSLYAI